MTCDKHEDRLAAVVAGAAEHQPRCALHLREPSIGSCQYLLARSWVSMIRRRRMGVMGQRMIMEGRQRARRPAKVVLNAKKYYERLPTPL